MQPTVSSEIVRPIASFSSIHGILALSSISNSHQFSHSCWVLDMGDTHHISCTLETFISSTPITNFVVMLPNGNSVPISRVGSVSLSPHIILDNVLFIPQFQFNLPSISWLTQSHKYSVKFLPDFCFIPDLTQGVTIGKGR